MKKGMRLLLMCVFAVISIHTGARLNIRPYVQLSVGADPVTYGGDAWTVKPEVGVDINFINISVVGILSTNMLFKDYERSIDLKYETATGGYVNIYGRTANSFMLNVGVDFIKIFNTRSKHSLSLYAAGGYTQFGLLDSRRGNDFEYMRSQMNSVFDYCISASYQYQIAEKWRIGVYVDEQGIEEIATVGVNLRRYF
ncbi:MAG: hypothetical protein LBG28_09835 [Tannerella sp.]|jgi:hypothetical protein|nr:hypothetical protein [Tannerella sp.]